MIIRESGLDVQIMVFCTSLKDTDDLRRTEIMLNSHPQIWRWSADLQDSENILKVVTFKNCTTSEITHLISNLGYSCKEL